MFPKNQRLNLSHTKFSGTKLKGVFLTIVINQATDAYQVGAVVSKKIATSAVMRNRLRRRLLHAVRYIDYKSKKPLQILLIPQKNALDASFQNLRKDIANLLERAMPS